MQEHNSIKQEILQDKKNGKEQPWQPKKVRSLMLADSFKRLGLDKKAQRVRFCGSTLGFLRMLETGEKTLAMANFCRERLCPMCSWRKSLKVFHQTSLVMDKVQQEHKDLVPLFLTLTLRNCEGQDLSSTLDLIFKGWYQLTKHRKIKRIIKGWMRSLEVTYNKESDTFHPHVHAIILVEKGYFKGKDYMETNEWVKMWQTALKLDYEPICDIRKVKNKGNYKSVAEIAKYTLKDTEYITNDEKLTDKLVDILGNALRGRRLYAFGGVMKKAAKELEIENPEDGNLVNIDEQKIRDDVATVLEIYNWNFGMANYVRAGNQ